MTKQYEFQDIFLKRTKDGGYAIHDLHGVFPEGEATFETYPELVEALTNYLEEDHLGSEVGYKFYISADVEISDSEEEALESLFRIKNKQVGLQRRVNELSDLVQTPLNVDKPDGK